MYKDAGLGNPDLSQCDMSHASLASQQPIENVSFRGATLSDTDFSCTTLLNVDFEGCNLSDCDFTFCEASQCNFEHAMLVHTIFTVSSHYKCNFNLVNADFSNFDLCKINNSFFAESSLMNATLRQSQIKNTDMANTFLNCSSLIEADLSGSTLSGVTLYGTARSDWNIKEVECTHVYWDHYRKERFPPEHDFKKGEFTTQHRPYTEFSYTFKEGITPLDLMLATHIVDQINAADTSFTIKIDNASLRGLNPTLNFIMESGEANRDEAKELFKTIYEHKISFLEEKLQSSEKLLTERALRVDLAEEQLAEMTSVVKQTFSGEKFGLNARQLLIEHLFNPIMEEVLSEEGLIAQHVISKSKNIAPKNPILIEGLPGIGNVGKIAL